MTTRFRPSSMNVADAGTPGPGSPGRRRRALADEDALGRIEARLEQPLELPLDVRPHPRLGDDVGAPRRRD